MSNSSWHQKEKILLLIMNILKKCNPGLQSKLQTTDSLREKPLILQKSNLSSEIHFLKF